MQRKVVLKIGWRDGNGPGRKRRGRKKPVKANGWWSSVGLYTSSDPLSSDSGLPSKHRECGCQYHFGQPIHRLRLQRHHQDSSSHQAEGPQGATYGSLYFGQGMEKSRRARSHQAKPGVVPSYTTDIEKGFGEAQFDKALVTQALICRDDCESTQA